MKNFSIRELFEGSFITWLFLGIQTIVYLVMAISAYFDFSQGSILVYSGVMSAPYVVLQHEYWRFFTPIFIHFGFMHYAVNSVVLYYMGSQIEKIYGHGRFFLIYILSGMLGNMVSFMFNQPGVISGGASTSLFGLFGAFIILGAHHHENPYVRSMAKQFTLFILLSFAFGIFDQTIDFYGHIGGLLGGILLSNIVCLPRPNEKYKWNVRILSLILFVFFVIICLMYGFKKFL